MIYNDVNIIYDGGEDVIAEAEVENLPHSITQQITAACLQDPRVRKLARMIYGIDDISMFLKHLAVYLANLVVSESEMYNAWARTYLRITRRRLTQLYYLDNKQMVNISDPVVEYEGALAQLLARGDADSSPLNTYLNNAMRKRRLALQSTINGDHTTMPSPETKRQKLCDTENDQRSPSPTTVAEVEAAVDSQFATTSLCKDTRQRKVVRFAENALVLGFADTDVDRSSCTTSIPDLAETIKLRADRVIPRENFPSVTA